MEAREFDHCMKNVPGWREAAEAQYHPICLAAKLEGCGFPCIQWSLVREPAVEKKIKIQHGLLADDKPQSRYHAMADPSCEAERAKLEAWRAGR